MLNRIVSAAFLRLGGPPCFRVHGKLRRESAWRTIDVLASHRHDAESRWPLLRNTCVTWSDAVIVVGWSFAEEVLREQRRAPASRDRPVEVMNGRLRSAGRGEAQASEILAHEIGHTGQALRLGPLYLPVVGSLTLFREGLDWWNHFENQASEQGQFGGIVNGSVCAELAALLHSST
jgi:hypothetical protein